MPQPSSLTQMWQEVHRMWTLELVTVSSSNFLPWSAPSPYQQPAEHMWPWVAFSFPHHTYHTSSVPSSDQKSQFRKFPKWPLIHEETHSFPLSLCWPISIIWTWILWCACSWPVSVILQLLEVALTLPPSCWFWKCGMLSCLSSSSRPTLESKEGMQRIPAK